MKRIPPDNYEVFWDYAWQSLDPPPPIDEWLVKPGCEDIAALYREYGCTSILEAASGLGMKALMFRHLGFEVLGTDICDKAVGYARRLARAVGLDVEFRALAWADIPGQLDGRFDAVYIDQCLNVRSREELLEAARAAHAALRPDGVFVNGSREEAALDLTPDELVERAWERKKTPGVWWALETPEGPVTTIEMCERFDDGIYHHFLHLHNNRHLLLSGWLESFRWSLDDCCSALSDAGFRRVIRRKVKLGSGERIASIGLK